MRRLLLSMVVLCGLQATAVAEQMHAPSFWKNQRGSELRITSVGRDGTVRGTFTNYAPNYQCKGIRYPISGRTNLEVTTFTVNFARCRTITTLRGTVQGLGFAAPWTLQHNGQTEWGYDIFFRN